MQRGVVTGPLQPQPHTANASSRCNTMCDPKTLLMLKVPVVAVVPLAEVAGEATISATVTVSKPGDAWE